MDALAFTVTEFCQAHRVSRRLFYLLIKRGQGPAVMKIGHRTCVSVEAAAAWRREREKEAAELGVRGAKEA